MVDCRAWRAVPKRRDETRNPSGVSGTRSAVGLCSSDWHNKSWVVTALRDERPLVPAEYYRPMRRRMFRDDRPPLPNWILDAYRQLATQIQSRDGGLPTEEAETILTTAEIDESDAEYALGRLLDRGYLYQVEDELFVTLPDELDDEEP